MPIMPLIRQNAPFPLIKRKSPLNRHNSPFPLFK